MGALIERVLVHGEDPRDIPISTLSRFTFLLRLEVAQRLRLYPPLEVLDFAKIIDRQGE
jgi:putative ABC transport system substrate-binding protein